MDFVFIITAILCMAALILLCAYAAFLPGVDYFISHLPFFHKTKTYTLPVPYTVTWASALGAGFFMCCVVDKTATEFNVDSARECWEQFSGISSLDPDFKNLIAHYQKTGWYCIHSKRDNL